MFLAIGLGCGCSTYRDQSARMNRAWAAGDAGVAAQAYSQRAAERTDAVDSVVWHLEAGAAHRAAGDFIPSNSELEAAADRIERLDRQPRISLSRETAALFSNPQNLPYAGRAHERIMLNTYRALNFLALGDLEKARPELIRAYQYQQDAVRANRRTIEEARRAEAEDPQSAAIGQTRKNPEFQSLVGSITRDLEGFRFYADYVNPFTVYLDGLFFLHAGSGGSDVERAAKSLARVAELLPENPSVQADFAAAQAVLAGQSRPEGITYIILESGRGPRLGQERISIPIIVTTVSYIGVAFPRLEFHEGHVRKIDVVGGGRSLSTELVASMDSIVALDFKQEFPAVVTRTLLSALAKGAASYAINEAARQQGDEWGVLAGALTAVFQTAVNIADTRCWSTLPKEFQVARLNTPPDRHVTLVLPDGQRIETDLIDGGVNVVYVKTIAAGTPTQITQFTLR